MLPYRILPIHKAFFLLPDGIQLHQILGYFRNRTFDFTLGPAPFLRSQLIQLRLPTIRRCVFLNHIQAGSQNIEVPPIPIFNFNIILNYLLNLYFFNPFINTKPMIFMNDIIPHFQLCKIMDFLPFVFFPFLFLLLFQPENIAFRYHHKLNQRIFKPFQYPAVKSHNLPRLYFAKRILAIESSQILPLQILGKPLRPCPRAGQEQDPIPVFPIPLQILQQCFKTIIIGSNALCTNIEFFFRFKKGAFPIHSSQSNHFTFPHFCRHFPRPEQDICLSGQGIALFQTVHHTFAKFQLHRIRMFLYPCRFIYKNAALILIKQLHKRNGFRIKITDIAFQVRRSMKFHHLFFQFLYLNR